MDDVDAARKDLIARGVEVSEIFHYAGGPFNNAVENPRVAGQRPVKLVNKDGLSGFRLGDAFQADAAAGAKS